MYAIQAFFCLNINQKANLSQVDSVFCVCHDSFNLVCHQQIIFIAECQSTFSTCDKLNFVNVFAQNLQHMMGGGEQDSVVRAGAGGGTRLRVCVCEHAALSPPTQHNTPCPYRAVFTRHLPETVRRSRLRGISDNIDISDQTTASEPEPTLNIPGPNCFVCFYLILEQQPAVLHTI